MSKNDARARRQLELIAEYRRTKSQAAFLELLDSVRGTIGMVIRRYSGSGLPTEELSAEATVGFILALERYDPERGPFSATVQTYARKTIDACVHQLSRPTSGAYGRQERALQLHGGRLYRECLDVGLPASVAVDLVSESMGYDARHVAAAMTRQQSGSWSIDDGDRGDGLAGSDEEPEEAMAASDRSRVLDQLLAELPHEQEIVIRRRLLVEDGQRAYRPSIAAELGIYEGRIPQLERDGLAALRAGLDERGLTLADLI